MLSWTTRLQRRPGRQSGVTLVEALVALVVMSFGMVALVGLMANLRSSGDIAKQRGEAMRLAHNELERLRSYTVLTSAAPDVIAFDRDLVKAAWTIQPNDSNATFAVSRDVEDVKAGDIVLAKSIRITVTWTDRTGATAAADLSQPQSVTLDTIIPRLDPTFMGAVGITPASGGTRQPSDRHPAIPVKAKDLDNKKSVFRPSDQKSQVWVFNNATGVITSVCDLSDPNKDISIVSETDLTACTPSTAYLLTGTVWFSNSDPANPAIPEAKAIRLDLQISDGVYSGPAVDTSGKVLKDAGGNVLFTTYTATAPRFDCFDDAPTNAAASQGFVNYSCIVYPDAVSKRWSGRLGLTDLTIGTGASDYRVCRYSADYNGNGTAETKKGNYIVDNYEHPDVYVNVAGPLTRQNFLVVRGDLSCPSAPDVDPANGIFVDYKTVQHQPS